jgi:tRNA (guanine37-N1)-methyltransferase
MRFDILTIFPEMFSAFLKAGILGRAVKKGLIDIGLVNIRDFTDDPHRSVDDRPYGGGSGMVMKPEPIDRALESIVKTGPVILLSPQGKKLDQTTAWILSDCEQIILICGRYEGVDERIRLSCVDLELSIGDFILNGGEIGAMVVIEAVSRLIPGVLGGEKSNREDTFEDSLLKYPQYTRPDLFKGMEVPNVILSGDHEKIRLWRRTESLKRTLEKRADLINKAQLTPEDKAIIKKLLTSSRLNPRGWIQVN